MPAKTLRHRPNIIFHVVHNCRINYARNDTVNRICKEGNEVADKFNFFQQSIIKFQANLKSLLQNYQN